MTTNAIIETLKQDAKNDPATNAVCHVFALRKRARHMVSVRALASRMEKEGFQYETAQYAKILKRLSELGLGRLDTDSKGRVRALKEIKMTLQSIGTAAVGEEPRLAPKKTRNRFSRLPVKEANAKAVERVWKAPELKTVVKIGIMINDRIVDVQIPKGLTREETAVFLAKFVELT